MEEADEFMTGLDPRLSKKSLTMLTLLIKRMTQSF